MSPLTAWIPAHGKQVLAAAGFAAPARPLGDSGACASPAGRSRPRRSHESYQMSIICDGESPGLRLMAQPRRI